MIFWKPYSGSIITTTLTFLPWCFLSFSCYSLGGGLLIKFVICSRLNIRKCCNTMVFSVGMYVIKQPIPLMPCLNICSLYLGILMYLRLS